MGDSLATGLVGSDSMCHCALQVEILVKRLFCTFQQKACETAAEELSLLNIITHLPREGK